MIETVLAVLSGILTLVLFFVKRENSPIHQAKERYDQIDKDITSGKSDQITINASADLDRLEQLQNARRGK